MGKQSPLSNREYSDLSVTPQPSGRFWIFFVCGGVLLLVAVGLYILEEMESVAPGGSEKRQERQADVYFPGPEERALCQKFLARKNANDPSAGELLGPPPVIPDAPVSPEEADRLDAEILLHGPLYITEVLPIASAHPKPATFALVLTGSLSSERLPVWTPNGTEVRQKVLYSPHLLVGVVDGKIHGIRPKSPD